MNKPFIEINNIIEYYKKYKINKYSLTELEYIQMYIYFKNILDLIDGNKAWKQSIKMSNVEYTKYINIKIPKNKIKTSENFFEICLNLSQNIFLFCINLYDLIKDLQNYELLICNKKILVESRYFFTVDKELYLQITLLRKIDETIPPNLQRSKSI